MAKLRKMRKWREVEAWKIEGDRREIERMLND
jgi:hypothetical protein